MGRVGGPSILLGTDTKRDRSLQLLVQAVPSLPASSVYHNCGLVPEATICEANVFGSLKSPMCAKRRDDGIERFGVGGRRSQVPQPAGCHGVLWVRG